MGASTTALVRELDRNYVGIELKFGKREVEK
jgi:hypothetical protein